MRSTSPFSAFGVLLILVTRAAAADPSDAATFTKEQSRWSISAGAMVRSIDADFHVARPAPLPWQSIFRGSSSGAGDVGLYKGGPGSVHYADGSVGPDYGLTYDKGGQPTGDAGGLINSSSQLSLSGRINDFGVGTAPIFDLAFHSSGSVTSYGSTSALHGLDAADSDVGVGPYVSLSYVLWSGSRDSFSVSLGWSFVQSHHGTAGYLGQQTIGSQTVNSRYSYHYDYDPAGGAANPGATFPFNANQLGQGFIIYDPVIYSGPLVQGGTGFIAPRESVQSTATGRVAALLGPVATERLQVSLNEVVFAAQYQRDLTDRLHVGLSAGPTLNVIDSTLDTTIDWFQAGRARPLATVTEHVSDTSVKVGLMGQVSVTYDLTKRLFLETHGSFRWVDPVSVSGSMASTRVNPTSWEGGVGVGYRF